MDGIDNRSCGRSADTACYTLDQVLGLYYKTGHPSGLGLEIITAKSLAFDQQIVVFTYIFEYF